MKKILILLFITVNFAFADYHFIVENSTMVDAYENLFNAIAMIFSADSYVDLLRFIFLLGGFFTFLLSIQRASEAGNVSSLSPYIKYLIVGVIILTLAFSKKENIWITTNNIPSYCAEGSHSTGAVVKIPSALAFGFSTINKIGTNLTKLAETAFYPPSYSGTPSLSDNQGYMGALKTMIKLQNVEFKDLINSESSVDFEQAFGYFYNQCFFSVIQNKSEATDILLNFRTEKNLFGFFEKFLDYEFEAVNVKPRDNLITISGQEVMSCGEYFENVLKKGAAEVKDAIACTMPGLNSGVLELLTKSPKDISQMQDVVIQAGMVKQMSRLGHKWANLDNFAGGKTQAETNYNSLSTASYMAEMLPYLQMTIRAVLYAFFPFVFVTILLPGGIKVLAQYGKTLLWVELWGPTAAVVNMFVNLQVKSEVGEQFSQNGLNMINSINMLSEANTIAGVGGMLYLSIPPLTWLILTGSAQMMGNLMTGMAGKISTNISSDAQARDFAKIDLQNKTGVGAAEKERLAAQYAELSSYSESLAYSDLGGMDYFQTKFELDKGKFGKNISEVANQDYFTNQVLSGQKQAGKTQGEIEAYLSNGGITAEQKLAQTNQDLAYKENKLLTDNFSNSQIAGSNFENKKENIIKTLEQKSSLENTFGNSGNAYTMEGQKSAEDRKADLRKIDVNDDKKLTNSEISTYGSDVSTKAIADQNSLKAKNEQLLKEADNLANSSNLDVKEMYNRNLNTFGSKEAAAAATLAAIQTKEQSFKGRETSQNIDTFNSSNISPETKGKEGALTDVKDVNQKIENREQYKQLMQEDDLGLNKTFAAQKEAIIGHSNARIINEMVKDKVISRDDLKNMEKAGELNERLEKFGKGIEEVKARGGNQETIDYLNSKKSELENEVLAANKKIEGVSAKMENYTSSDIKQIKKEAAIELRKIDEKANSIKDDVTTSQTRGQIEARKLETINDQGEERLVIRNQEGQRVTDVNTAKMGLIREGNFNLDASYYASKLSKDTGHNHDNAIAAANTAYKYAKEIRQWLPKP